VLLPLTHSEPLSTNERVHKVHTFPASLQERQLTSEQLFLVVELAPAFAGVVELAPVLLAFV